MSGAARILGIVAALALAWYVWNYAAEADAAEGSDMDTNALIALWAARYAVDVAAVQAIILQEQFTGQGVVAINPPASGAWTTGDSGQSHGPMQIYESGAIAAWIDAGNADPGGGLGDYSALDAVGSSLAIQIGTWYLAQALQTGGGYSAFSFGKYNAGLAWKGGATQKGDPVTYGSEAFDNYTTLSAGGATV